MMLLKYKDNIVNLDGLRNIEYSNTNHQLHFYFSNGGRVDWYINDKDLKDIYERLFKIVEKRS